jgi:hypothetical protein
MRKLIAGAVLALAIAGCGGSSVDACEQGMRQQFQANMADPNRPQETIPNACKGLDEKTLQRIAAKIMQEELGKVFTSTS